MLRAFTIIELIVAMVLSTTVASLAYLVYNNSVRIYNLRQQHSGRDEELLSFSSILGIELQKAKLSEFSDSSLTIALRDGSIVTYEFSYPEILRHSAGTVDTIKISYKELKLSFLGNLPPVIERFDIIVESDQGTIDTLKNNVFYSNEFKYNYLNSMNQYNSNDNPNGGNQIR